MIAVVATETMNEAAMIKSMLNSRHLIRIVIGSAAICMSSAAFSQVGHDADVPEPATELAARTTFRNPIATERLLKALPPATFDDLVTRPRAFKAPTVRAGDPGPDGGSRRAPKAPALDADAAPENFGQNPFGSGTNRATVYHYSDSLVDVEVVDKFPFRATGHFAYTAANGASYRCSASLISKSILVTAGHCVHQGGSKPGIPAAKGFDKDGAFYPARAGDSYPYGYATANYFVTTTKWRNVGAIESGYDVALVVLNKPVDTTTEFGTQVGFYGFCSADCLQPYWSLTQLGYPGNYASGMYMSEGQHIEVNKSNTDFLHGSGMQGGSSGGPHIANFGFLYDSTDDQGRYPARNIVFSVTSWGYTDDIYKIQGSSSLSGPNNANNFPAMWNMACTRARKLHGADSCSFL